MTHRRHTPHPGKLGAMAYTDRQLLAALRRHALGDRTLSRAQYEQRRGDTGPSTPLYDRRFGTWNEALTRAGLEPTVQAPQLQGVSTKWTDQDMLDSIRRCLEVTGKTTINAYEDWRRSLPKDDPVPGASVIRLRMGSWSAAIARACAQPDQNDR